MRQRAEFGFRADEAYVRELIERGVWEYDVGYIPVTPAENTYLRLRDKLTLGAKAERYLRRRRNLSGGVSIMDDWPRGPYILIHLTRDRLSHEYNLKQLVPYPNNLRTDEVRYSERHLNRIVNRIFKDSKALKRAGFDLSEGYADTDTNTAYIGLTTRRTDATDYFKRRYGPVTVDVIATDPYTLECEDAGHFEVSGDGRRLTVFWTRSGSARSERVDVVEYPDRVEVGVVDRLPNGFITLDAVPDHRRVRLSAPLGDRAVIDMADRRRLLQQGPSPGEPPCPARKPHTKLDEAISIRKEIGLPHGRAYVRRMLRRKVPYTKAELRYQDLQYALELEDIRISRYVRKLGDEYGGSDVEGRFPGKPRLVVRFKDRVAFHERKLRRIVKHPDRLRVVRATYSVKELGALERRIQKDAVDGFIDGYGDAGFFVTNTYTDRGRVFVRVLTPRADARAYFREQYGPAVKVSVSGKRYECGDPDFF
jgi:hypothetical protein